MRALQILADRECGGGDDETGTSGCRWVVDLKEDVGGIGCNRRSVVLCLGLERLEVGDREDRDLRARSAGTWRSLLPKDGVGPGDRGHIIARRQGPRSRALAGAGRDGRGRERQRRTEYE